MDNDVSEHLKSLHTGAIDARNGYSEALHDAHVGDLLGLFREMIAIHQKNEDELTVQLRKRGDAADEDGSFMSTVHRTIMDIRSLFGGLDDSVLPGLIDGEERNMDRYTKALAITGLSEEERDLIINQRARLEAALIQMRSRNATAGA